jgi:hypothetical protein
MEKGVREQFLFLFSFFSLHASWTVPARVSSS